MIALDRPEDLLAVLTADQGESLGVPWDADVARLVEGITVNGDCRSECIASDVGQEQACSCACWETDYALVSGMPQMRLKSLQRVSIPRWLVHRIAGKPYGTLTRRILIGRDCGNARCVRPEHFDFKATGRQRLAARKG